MNGHLRAWLAERATDPWPWYMSYPMPARDLCRAYNETLVREGHQPMTETAFGREMNDMPYSKDRIPSGHVYNGLMLTTRSEKAEANIVSEYAGNKRAHLYTAAQDEHMARVEHVEVATVRQSGGRWADSYDVEQRTPIPCDPAGSRTTGTTRCPPR